MTALPRLIARTLRPLSVGRSARLLRSACVVRSARLVRSGDDANHECRGCLARLLRCSGRPLVDRPIPRLWHLCAGLIAFGLICNIGCRQVKPEDTLVQPPGQWLIDPATATVSADAYPDLFDAFLRVLRDHGFRVDRSDYRDGEITTEPVVSAQPLEFWRKDVATNQDAAVSAMGTVRRQVHVRIRREPDGRYVAEPRVLIERFASRERRVSVAQQWRSALSAPIPRGNRESDTGLEIPDQYWYPLKRDVALERVLADDAAGRLPDAVTASASVP